ncbi:MAG: glycosyltransferase family 2 protein [Bacteroidetes bacterium]|nr:glycosyltransferase family 2 protein [Bacteroidota bacterium]
MSPKVSIVILNFNTRFFLEKLIPFLIKTDYDNFEIIVADNASIDGSADFIKEFYPEIKLICFDENYGFAGGYNKALEQIESDYFVLLNSDVEVTQNWLKPLISLAQSDSKIAVVQPKLLDYNSRNKFEYAGGSGGFIDKYGYPFCRGRWFNFIEFDTKQYNDTREIFWASGACFLIKSEYWKKSGGLDEDFFAHMEEIDLCWRLKNDGYKIMVCPESVVYHIGGGTLPVGNPHKTYLNFRNGLFLLCKNLNEKVLFKTLFIRFVFDGLAAFKFLTEFKFREIAAILRAHIVFYGKMKYWLNKRKNESEKQLHPYGMYNKSIVLGFYLYRQKRFSQTNL